MHNVSNKSDPERPVDGCPRYSADNGGYTDCHPVSNKSDPERPVDIKAKVICVVVR
jgi:hypothetical protein